MTKHCFMRQRRVFKIRNFFLHFLIFKNVNFEHPTPKGLFMDIQKINL